jgi:hypothetical protein
MLRKPPAQVPSKRSDLVLSLALPIAVIGLGVGLSVGTERFGAIVDLCLAPFR